MAATLPINTPTAQTSARGRSAMFAASFLAWLFAGLENSLFILIHRQMMYELLGSGVSEKLVTQWFAWNQAAFMLGAAAGGWLFGALGDRFGRTRALAWSVLCYSLLHLVAWFVTDAQLMWIIRFAACLGFGGTWPNAMALMSEAWPSASKPLMAGVMGTAANFGFVLLGLIGLYAEITNEHWRWMLLVGASPGFLGLWILAVVPESSRWIEFKATTQHSEHANRSVRSGIRPLFRPPLLKQTLLGISLGAVPVIGTAANANWVVPWTDQVAAQKAAAEAAVNPSGITTAKPDPKQKVRTQISRSTGAIFGSLLGGILASLAGRRLTYFLISLMTFLVSTFLFTQLTPGEPWFSECTMLLGFFGVTYFGWLPLFLPELFPTPVRAAGSGISFNSGRILAALVVVVVGLRMNDFQGDYGRIGFFTGFIYVVGMIIIWFAPRESLTHEWRVHAPGKRTT